MGCAQVTRISQRQKVIQTRPSWNILVAARWMVAVPTRYKGIVIKSFRINLKPYSRNPLVLDSLQLTNFLLMHLILGEEKYFRPTLQNPIHLWSKSQIISYYIRKSVFYWAVLIRGVSSVSITFSSSLLRFHRFLNIMLHSLPFVTRMFILT